MRYVVTGRLRRSCQLSPEEYFLLAVREWELVLRWIAQGKALGYGRLGTPGGGTVLLDVESEREARALAQALPFAPYAELTVSRVDSNPVARGVPMPILGAPAGWPAPRAQREGASTAPSR